MVWHIYDTRRLPRPNGTGPARVMVSLSHRQTGEVSEISESTAGDRGNPAPTTPAEPDETHTAASAVPVVGTAPAVGTAHAASAAPTTAMPVWPAPVATAPATAEVRVPGSKSMTGRALILGAGSLGTTVVHHPLLARDTDLMAAGLRLLGDEVDTAAETRWTVRPMAQRPGPTPMIDVGLAGTVMRFLPPIAATRACTVTFDGDPRARQRPLGPLVNALRELGVPVGSSRSDGLPITVRGAASVAGGTVTLDASASSQLVSGLLLAGSTFDKGLVVRHVGPPVPSAPHLRMTVQMLRAAGVTVDDSEPDVWAVAPGRPAAREWLIEPDLSGAAPFLAAALVTGGRVTVPDWPAETTQPGDRLRDVLAAMGGTPELTDTGLTVTGTGTVHGIDLDLSEIGELTPVIAALAALAESPSRLRGIGHIRAHETDRLAALATELTKLGARVDELPDGLAIHPGNLHGSRFETYDDHRMAHAGAVIGLRVPGVDLTDVTCTTKTMPRFPQLWSAMVSGTGERPGGGA